MLCILGIVYVHAWTGLGGDALNRLSDTPQGLLRWVLVELLGRSAVPLLGMISGWLVAGSVGKRTYRAFLAGKARGVLAPMILWNALAILLVGSAAYAGLIKAPMPTTWWWTIDELFCLATPDDINVQMSFLRDLFLCMAAAPLLVRLPSRAIAAIALAALGWSLWGIHLLILLRPSILFFFLLGLLARRGGWAAWIASRPIAMVAIPYAALALVKVRFETAYVDIAAIHPVLMAALDMMMRFVTALFFWSIAWRLASSRAAKPLLRVEPYIFLMFCAHLIMIWLLGPLIGKFTGTLGSPLYPVFLLLQPPLALLATIGLGRALVSIAPSLALLLSGGRLKPATKSGTPPPGAKAAYP